MRRLAVSYVPTTAVALNENKMPNGGIDFHGKRSRPTPKGVSLATGRFLLRPHRQYAGAPVAYFVTAAHKL